MDWFGFDDPTVPRRLTPPSGLEAVHQDGFSWARQGTRKEDTSWISPDQWNRLVAQMRGLLNDPAIDVSGLAVNSPLLLRSFIGAKIVAILANIDVPSYGLMPKAIYDPDDDGIIGLAQGGTGVAATDNADLRDKLGVTTAISAAVAALVASSPAALDTLNELAAALGNDANFAATMTSALAGKLAVDGANIGANGPSLRSALGVAYADLPFLAVPVGGLLAVPTHLTGVGGPATGNPLYRFARLTAGFTGAGQENQNVLGSESVSGSAPLVLATAVVTLSGSPLAGQTIRLLNTEGRFLRPGTLSGTVRADQFQNHSHPSIRTLSGQSLPSGGGSNDVMAEGGTLASDVITAAADTGTYRAGPETYPKHIELTYYMRVK